MSDAGPGQCWCCGKVDRAERLVRLGNHPEVALCVGCARWAAKQAWEIEDSARSGPLVRARDGVRSARRQVVDRGWHRLPVVGGVLRRLGRYVP